MSSITSNHERLDWRSLALHHALADAIHRDAGVVDHVLRNLTRWKQTACGNWIAE